MSDDTFYQRLSSCADAGDLTPADLSYWFDRPYHTVWFWIRDKRSPRGTNLQTRRLNRRLELLEKSLRQCIGMPIPIDLDASARPKYIMKLRHDLETGAL